MGRLDVSSTIDIEADRRTPAGIFDELEDGAQSEQAPGLLEDPVGEALMPAAPGGFSGVNVDPTGALPDLGDDDETLDEDPDFEDDEPLPSRDTGFEVF